MGDSNKAPLRLKSNSKVRLKFHSATITSDAGLLACRELDDALGLTDTANEHLQERRLGRNTSDINSSLRSDSPYTVAWLATRIPTMPNDWHKTQPCGSLWDGKIRIDGAMAHTVHQRVILDMDSSESPVRGQQVDTKNSG